MRPSNVVLGAGGYCTFSLASRSVSALHTDTSPHAFVLPLSSSLASSVVCCTVRSSPSLSSLTVSSFHALLENSGGRKLFPAARAEARDGEGPMEWKTWTKLKKKNRGTKKTRRVVQKLDLAITYTFERISIIITTTMFVQRPFAAVLRASARSAVKQTRPSYAVSSYRGLSSSRYLFNAQKEGEKEAAEKEAKEAVEEELSPIEKDLKDLKAKLEKKEKELVEMKDLYVRSIADFRNLQETTKREIQKAKDFALQKFAKDLIESIDNFGHALSAVKEDSVKANDEIKQLYDGVKLTRDVFEKTLSRHGLKKIDPLDEEFDPNKHEATFQAPNEEKEPGTVFYVQQPGYELNGRVLRAAKVGIVKAKDN